MMLRLLRTVGSCYPYEQGAISRNARSLACLDRHARLTIHKFQKACSRLGPSLGIT